jgi:hypothetical protein
LKDRTVLNIKEMVEWLEKEYLPAPKKVKGGIA